ncbi:MAG: hypothetical protein HY879_09570 [Deltaproteobacteria bacterium]|nr:hypothetical protein [Deltaproteobacteria bacterium]
MIRTNDRNIRMIIQVAKRLGDLRGKVVFLGGCAAGLFITDPAMPEVRVTKDVDVIVEITSMVEYYKLEKELRNRGFEQGMNEDSSICRWLIEGIKVDVMPTQEDILGFSNRWYLPAIKNAVKVELKKGLTIRLVSSPYFLATKIEAFKGRGHGDYMASHDLEDIIIVLDGRPEIVAEIRNSSQDLINFLSGTFQRLLADEGFREAIPGHLLPDRASQARMPRIINCLEEIAEIKI